MLEALNETVNKSVVGRYFKLEERDTNLSTEFKGAVATFLTSKFARLDLS